MRGMTGTYARNFVQRKKSKKRSTTLTYVVLGDAAPINEYSEVTVVAKMIIVMRKMKNLSASV
jgi:hypothetical protein